MRDVVLTGITATIDTPMRWTPSAEERDRADAMVAAVGLSHKTDDVWPTLSQGERGCTLIARALVSEPRLRLARRHASRGRVDPRHAPPRGAADHDDARPADRRRAHVAAGDARATVTTETVSAAFDHPVTVGYAQGRWTARAKVTRIIEP